MITIKQYIGGHEASPDWTPERLANATVLLWLCSQLELEMIADGVEFPDNPKTADGVGGQFHGYGGFRPQDCTQGAPHSSHKEGRAVDRYDPAGAIDAWLMAHLDALERHGIYIEHPDSTPGWSHWSNKAPGSGHHVFYP